MSFLINFISGIKNKYSEELRTIPEKEALDAFIYGINCNRIKLGEKYIGILSISDKIVYEINFLDKTRKKIDNIPIKLISNITFNNNSENLKNYIKSNDDNINNEEMRFIQISINQKTYDFEFDNKQNLFLFIKGFLIYIETDGFLINIKNKGSGDYIEKNIERLFDTINDNFDDLLDQKEFQHLAKEIGIDAKELLLYIDINKDGIITKEEVINYFKGILKDLEFKEIFEKYATRKNNETNIYTMNQEELKLFFLEEQKEQITDLELYQLIILYNSKINRKTKRKMCKKFKNIFFYNKNQINKDKISSSIIKLNNKLKLNESNDQITLELNAKEFSDMLNSSYNTVYNKAKQNNELDTSHSLVDYYINSSHNTYLKGHQLKGLSDPKMYSYAILAGYKLVELDCYNGEGDDIIITHGFTLVTKLKLEDVLIELRENAFKNSPYPVILSIENHLDDKHQQIMANKFKKYLIDLYIFPTDSPPEFMPTLEELKYKFIIKCGGKRLYEDIDIPMKPINEESSKLKEKENLNKKLIIEDNFSDASDSEEDIESQKMEEFDFEKKEHIILVNRNTNIYNNNNINEPNKNSELFCDNLEINISENKQNNESDNFILRGKKTNLNNNKTQKEESKEIKSIIEINEINTNNKSNVNSNENENQNKLINLNKQSIEKEKEEIEIIPCLANVRGLLGQKFKYEKIHSFNYKPWEFVTLKSTQFLQFFKKEEKREELIKLSFHCMLKAYPQNFDSSNYDIIKCWACGCQCPAINIQAADDDFTLFNKIFFTQNNNCGYILKPKKFIQKFFYFEQYKKPKFVIKMKIINLFNFAELMHLAKINFENKSKLQIKIYTLDLSSKIEETETKEKPAKNEYIFNLEGNLINPKIINNEIIKLPVYEEELGGIMIKFLYDKDMIGRGCIPFCLIKYGYRRIPIYCNNCIERDRIFVVGYFEKSFL
jgi:hypothetical protein